jgi:hypothetical protein
MVAKEVQSPGKDPSPTTPPHLPTQRRRR